MAGENRRDRRGYLRDFKKAPDGSYVYTGDTWRADRTLRQQLLIKLWVLQAAMLSAAVLPGFVTTAGLLNSFYVILPYVFWIISDFYLAYTLGNMTFGGNPMRDYTYKRSVVRYQPCAMASFIGALFTALGMIVFLVRGGTGEGVAVCFVCCAIQILLSVLAKKCAVLSVWSKDVRTEEMHADKEVHAEDVHTDKDVQNQKNG